MGIEMLDGRDFSHADREGAAEIAIVNESFARRFLGAGSAAGRRFGTAADARAALEIVGVVEDSKWLSLREDPVPLYYRPFRQRPSPSAALVVHAPGRLAVVERSLHDLGRELVGRVDVAKTSFRSPPSSAERSERNECWRTYRRRWVSSPWSSSRSASMAYWRSKWLREPAGVRHSARVGCAERDDRPDRGALTP